jgi:hypothetical protein
LAPRVVKLIEGEFHLSVEVEMTPPVLADDDSADHVVVELDEEVARYAEGGGISSRRRSSIVWPGASSRSLSSEAHSTPTPVSGSQTKIDA